MVSCISFVCIRCKCETNIILKGRKTHLVIVGTESILPQFFVHSSNLNLATADKQPLTPVNNRTKQCVPTLKNDV